jgi:hypothetical protein
MVHYEDSEYLKPAGSTLVVRVDSINKAYGDVATFTEKFKLGGVTNGKLFCIAFMTSVSDSIFNLEDQLLTSVGMKFEEDYIYFDTQIFYGVHYSIPDDAYQEISYTIGLNWIKSILLPSGNFIWFTGEDIPLKEQIKKVNVLGYFCRFKDDIKNINPILIKENEEYYFYKVNDEEHLRRLPKELINREYIKF